MNRDAKKLEDIEKIKRVLYLLYNSNYCLNFFERTWKKDLGLFRLKLELIKSEKPSIIFQKASRAKDTTYVSLELDIPFNSPDSNMVSGAKVSDEEANEFEVEIQKQGYFLKGGGHPHYRVYNPPV